MVGQCSTCPGRWPGCSPVCPSCSACRVPGMNGQEWENGSKKKRKRNNNKKTAKNEVAAKNMFEALANENEDDMEFIVPTKPEVVFRTFFGRSSVGNRYGSRKNVTLVERYEKRKRIHGGASEAKLSKKNPVAKKLPEFTHGDEKVDTGDSVEDNVVPVETALDLKTNVGDFIEEENIVTVDEKLNASLSDTPASVNLLGSNGSAVDPTQCADSSLLVDRGGYWVWYWSVTWHRGHHVWVCHV